MSDYGDLILLPPKIKLICSFAKTTFIKTVIYFFFIYSKRVVDMIFPAVPRYVTIISWKR